eukprot:1192325-Prorocentrum_minimum.AAC.3
MIASCGGIRCCTTARAPQPFHLSRILVKRLFPVGTPRYTARLLSPDGALLADGALANRKGRLCRVHTAGAVSGRGLLNSHQRRLGEDRSLVFKTRQAW